MHGLRNCLRLCPRLAAGGPAPIRAISIAADVAASVGEAAGASESAHLINAAHVKGGHTSHPLTFVDPHSTRSPVLRTQLNEPERRECNLGRRRGHLSLGNSSTDAVRTLHFHQCELDRRPYVVTDRDGNSVYVDASPVMGKGKRRDFGLVVPVLRAMQTGLTAMKAEKAHQRLQIANTDSLLEQSKKLAIGPLEGGNTFKISDKLEGAAAAGATPSLSASFYVFTSGKAEAREVATRLSAAAATASGTAANTQSWADRRVRRAVVRKERGRQSLDRKLRSLIGDPIAVKNLRVKAGALDGYIREQQRKLTQAQSRGVSGAPAGGAI